jgi:hypothetical protein
MLFMNMSTALREEIDVCSDEWILFMKMSTALREETTEL